MSDREVEIRRELERVRSQIDEAYWLFTRTARGGVPPSMARPDLYARRRELQRELHALRASRRASS
ncbi:MAG: hypothetical protein SangKO_011090 [Sandaracinaceae bacterium]